MTPKEKAKELVEKLQQFSYCADGVNSMERQYQREDNAKQCALIAVDEIINNFGLFTEEKKHYCSYTTIEYYEKVKQQIENL